MRMNGLGKPLPPEAVSLVHTRTPAHPRTRSPYLNNLGAKSARYRRQFLHSWPPLLSL